MVNTDKSLLTIGFKRLCDHKFKNYKNKSQKEIENLRTKYEEGPRYIYYIIQENTHFEFERMR